MELQRIEDYIFEADTAEFILRVFGSKQEPWFRAQDIASILGYSNIRDRLMTLDIPSEWKHVAATDTLGGKQQCTFINEFAMYKLIMRSNKPIAQQFQNWICSEVLPSLRKTGSYDINRERRDDTSIRLEIYRTVLDAFERVGLDDRDRVMFKDYGRDLMITDGTKPLQEMSISRRLQEYHNYKNPPRKLLITLGKMIANKYREYNNGEDPIKREQYVDGTVRSVNHYNIADYEEFADTLISNYIKRLKPSV